jgi:hypothetical protein
LLLLHSFSPPQHKSFFRTAIFAPEPPNNTKQQGPAKGKESTSSSPAHPCCTALLTGGRGVAQIGIMLLCTVSLIFTFLVILGTYIGLPLYRNIQAAKSTGLLYKVVPFYHYNFITARIFNRTILRILNKILPEPAVTSWRVLVNANWPLKARHAVFKAFDTDSFVLVAPGGIIFTTADPTVTTQILSRDAQYPKAMYADFLSILCPSSATSRFSMHFLNSLELPRHSKQALELARCLETS